MPGVMNCIPTFWGTLQERPALWLALGLIAAAAYLLGCFNGAILTSRVFYHDDVRKHGSGNAGLTNFYRVYGARYAWCVIAADMLKAAAAIGFSLFMVEWSFSDPYPVVSKYFAGLFCMFGHVFPVTADFKGGKGILCSGMTLILIDWRIALVGWGLFVLLWAATKYVSLGSVCAAVSFPIMTYLVFHGALGGWADFVIVFILSLLMAGLVLFAHRGNIKRLLNGTESKFQWHKE